MGTEIKPPRVFISYSWTPEEHKNMTIDIAKRLMAEGVDVVLDVWDLHTGHDTYKFMEQMVSDDTIDYVLLMCSKDYAEKADKRCGGVGIEGTIVSPEVYKHTKQTKFIPIILEADNSGEAYKPIYLKPTFHIDLSAADDFETNLEMLIRHLFNKPLYEKPPLGSPPPYITNDSLILTCHGKLQRFKKDVHENNQICRKTLRDFSHSFFDDLAKMIPKKENVSTLPTQELHEYIIKKIEDSAVFTPMLEDLAELFTYGFNLITEYVVTGFLEDMLDFSTKTESELFFNGLDDPVYMDVLLLLKYEFFLLLITDLLKAHEYGIVKTIIEKTYTIKQYPSYRDNFGYGTSLTYTMFNHSLTIFQKDAAWKSNYRRQYNGFIESRLRKASIDDLVETDFLLSIMSYCRLDSQLPISRHWNSFICGKLPNPVHLFNRMRSKKEFDRVAPLFCVSTPQEMQDMLEGYYGRFLVSMGAYYPFDIYRFCEYP
ncbi:MAG: toll/interleukin-1 receptor domain-containing protein [Sphaerochaetaceae bacterium]|jgi:hypothetical protein|nr:toll/interleukin-1 receptor domain-containing protein [Candidatus Cloacimonadota bacterium]MDD2296521.1 toll/interleukin-1 receptor domain-containing protein [Sphaerochaetaceae bacterium]